MKRSPDKQLQPDFDVYYLFTTLYLFFLPSVILILSIIYNVDCVLDLDIFVPVLPLLTAVVIFLCTYLCIGFFKFPKPDNLFGIYLPIIVNFAWQFLLWILFNLFGDNNSTLLIALLSVNLYGIYETDAMNLQLTQLTGWIYNAAVFSGFLAGERLAFFKTKICRQPINRRSIRLVLIGCAVALLISESIWVYRRRNIVKTDPAHNGYGFAYENGLSSTNLEPYYVENEDNILARLNEPASYTVSDPRSMPVLDGAEAVYPVYSAFAYACYENIDRIQAYAKKNRYKSFNVPMPIVFNNSIIAFENLLAGECDLFFGAKPSQGQQEMAEKAGKELILTPIGREAFLFFVNSENPINGLSSAQIRDTYSGKINNWKKVGGENKRILPFQRPQNSGSQTMMEYFMGDAVIKQPLETEYVGSMGDMIVKTANYQNNEAAIGYSFRYFASIMAKDTGNRSQIKYLSVDGIYPDTDTIQSGEYPITTELYAVSLADNPNPEVKRFLQWMTSTQGQKIVTDTGYIALPVP